jgi:peptide alpha-N-acetyltransferase
LALEYITKAIEHTPTLHELYLVKAKVLKNQKEFVKAAEVTDYVRKLDLADRYLNNKAVKYSLQAH